uniref:Uncharacterized protein n=1 Tax=Sphaerodactylus townsendi TaxID=933632 RepID=A0ACB8FM49_9SAUR
MGPRTLCGLFLCHLIWLSCGSPVEVVEGNVPTDGLEDLSFLQAEYRLFRDRLCNKNWTPWGYNCYMYISTPRTFNDAEDECQSYSPNGHLVSIHSRDNTDFLARLLRNVDTDVWIGLYTLTGCNGWSWTDGTLYNPLSASWDEGQPHNCHNSNQVCLQVTHDSGVMFSPSVAPVLRGH